ncbi:Acg family FMN-binding oxidoreductase [Amycolatopsis sp. NPDC004368]
MTFQLAPVGRLSTEQVTSVLRAATSAPSTHNTQPWLFSIDADGIGLHADHGRVLPVADADGRELLLSCGAALFNLRAAIHAAGVNPVTTLFPRRDEPGLLALVRPRTPAAVDHRVAELAKAIPRRHTNRAPFGADPVPPAVLNPLRHAAEAEQAWLPQLDADQLAGLRELVHESHLLHDADPAFRAEWRRWTGGALGRPDGVPTAAETADDSWVLRDSGTAGLRPLVVVVGSFGDSPADRVRAGQAMQRVLLTATVHGLDASFISRPIGIGATRTRLRHLLGDGLWPQIVLRLGYGSPVAWTPRRALDEVLLDRPSVSA